MPKSNEKVQRLVLIGLLAALVFVFTYIGFDVPSPLGKAKVHMGNVMCLLGGLLFGGVPGGLAAGIGSGLFDLMDPAWAPEFWVTAINKFVMGFVAGVAVGAAASLLGWNAMSGALMRADVPLLLRRINLEKRLRSETVRRELCEKLSDSLSDPAGPFSTQVVEGFSRSFRGYLYSIAQAAEIPIA